MKKISFTLNTVLALILGHSVAANETTIRAVEMNSPVNVGIFKGFCKKLNLAQFKTSTDLSNFKQRDCEYITDVVLQPNKPKSLLKAPHIGSTRMMLVAFQPNGFSVQCPIRRRYTELYVREENGSLFCSSPQESDDDNEETSSSAPTPNRSTAKFASAAEPMDNMDEAAEG